MSDADGKSLLSGIEKQFQDIGEKFGEAVLSNLKPARLKEVFDEVEGAAMGIAKSFGVGRTNILSIKAAMTDAVGSVKELGFGFSDIAKIQQGIAENLGRNVVLNTESYKQLLATSKVTGVDAVTSANAFKAVGVSYMGVQNQMQKVIDVSRSMGVNAQAVSQKVVDNLGALNKYNFKNGIEGLSKMVAQSQAIGANFETFLSKADELFDPDEAIKMAASLQRLGVTQTELLDPLRLMDMAQNDPGELMNQMGKMSEKFVQLNKDGRFEIMPGAKRQLMEIAKEMDIPYSELTKMAVGSKELDMKLSKIKFPATFDDEQKNFIANLAEIGPGGEMTLTVDGEQMGIDKAMETFAKDKDALDKFMKDQEPKTMEELAKEQLTVQENQEILLAMIADTMGYGLAASKGGERLSRAEIEIYKNGIEVLKRTTKDKEGKEKTETFSEKGIRQGIGTQSDDLIKSLFKGDFKGAGEAGTNMANEFYNMFKEKMEKANVVYQESKVGSILTGEEGKTKTQVATTTTPKTAEMSYLDKLQKQVQAPTTQNLNYSGNLNVTFSAPPGVNTTEVERVLNELMKKPEFIQMIAQMAKDPTGKQNPSQQNMNFGR
jgi:hypothetical protein